MTDKQPDALALADALEAIHYHNADSILALNVIRQAGPELRRLHAESEALREDMQRFREDAHCERETRRQLERHVEALRAENELLHTRCQQAYTVGRQSGREDCEALLRQALEALENAWLDASMGKGDVARHTKAIDALRERLK